MALAILQSLLAAGALGVLAVVAWTLYRAGLGVADANDRTSTRNGWDEGFEARRPATHTLPQTAAKTVVLW